MPYVVKAFKVATVVLFYLSTALSATAGFGQTNADVVAIVDGVPITAAEVDRAIESRLRPLQMQIYSLRKTALDSLIASAVLKKEAARKGITTEELRKELTSAPVGVPPHEIEKSYADNAPAFGAMSPDEARERLRLDLETSARMKNYRDALARLQRDAQVDILLPEPRVTVAPAVAAASKGRADAKVTVVEFSDFECPYCRGAAPTLATIAREYDDKVRVVFKHLPLDGHAQAFPAARAAVCAAEQSRFWQYHDGLFAAESLSEERLYALATQVGLDRGPFATCLDAQRSSDAVVKDIQEARRLGINATPTFIVNGAVVPGAVSAEQLRRLIDRELNAQQTTSARP